MLSTATWQLWYNIRNLETLMDESLIVQLSDELWDQLSAKQVYQRLYWCELLKNNWLGIIHLAPCLDFPSRYIIVLGYTPEMLDADPDCHWSTTLLWYSITGDIIKL